MLIDIKYWFGYLLSLKDFIYFLEMLIIEYFYWFRFNDGIISICLFFVRLLWIVFNWWYLLVFIYML